MCGVLGSVSVRWKNLRLLSVLLASALVAGCATSGRLLEVIATPAQVPQFHPPLPAPVAPSPAPLVVLTPDVTRMLNDEGDPYVYFCLGAEDYLTMGAYNQRLLELIRQYRAIVRFYGHPDLETM